MVRVTLPGFAWFFVHYDKLIRRPPGPLWGGVLNWDEIQKKAFFSQENVPISMRTIARPQSSRSRPVSVEPASCRQTSTERINQTESISPVQQSNFACLEETFFLEIR